MDIKETLYIINRKDWRSWLKKNHKNKKEIWLIYYKKHAKNPRISYDHAVEEALCYGWIDSTVKKIDEERFAQRFTPRRENSPFSEINKERIRRMIKAGKMTEFGLIKLKEKLDKKIIISKDIFKVIKKDKTTWDNFQNFPEHYKKIRIAFIEGSRNRPEEFQKRLKHFLKMTSKNKKFGMLQ